MFSISTLNTDKFFLLLELVPRNKNCISLLIYKSFTPTLKVGGPEGRQNKYHSKKSSSLQLISDHVTMLMMA